VRLLVYGSLAYDRIMNFEGRFADHILPDKIHVLNVCFNLNGLKEKLGGTAGNIAYGLAQLGEKPAVLACLGEDGERYLNYLNRQGIDCGWVRTIKDEFTAGAFITTDKADNQITGFNPGAMNYPCGFQFDGQDPADSLAIVSPGGIEDMTGLPALFRKLGVPFIFDPGQSLNIWQGEVLAEAMAGAKVLISNDYELEMIMRMTGLDKKGLLALVQAIITTKGDQGSVLCQPQGERKVPAVPAKEVRDPTGAGDAFRAGLMKGLAQGLDLFTACLWGASLASFAVASYGTQEYTVQTAEFKAALDQALSLAGRR